MQAQHLGAAGAARFASALVEPGEQSGDLLDGCSIDDDSVHRAPRAFGRDRTGCRHQYLGRDLGHRPQPGRFQSEVWAAVLGVTPSHRRGEQLLDDLDGLEHAVDPLGGLGPVGTGHMLVDRLA